MLPFFLFSGNPIAGNPMCIGKKITLIEVVANSCEYHRENSEHSFGPFSHFCPVATEMNEFSGFPLLIMWYIVFRMPLGPSKYKIPLREWSDLKWKLFFGGKQLDEVDRFGSSGKCISLGGHMCEEVSFHRGGSIDIHILTVSAMSAWHPVMDPRSIMHDTYEVDAVMRFINVVIECKMRKATFDVCIRMPSNY